MGRSRLIQPQYFMNDRVNSLPIHCRLFFIGLWTLADREGRLKDRPDMLRIQILPLDKQDGNKMLTTLEEAKFITRYQVCGDRFIQINGWEENQAIHHKEKASEIPSVSQASVKHGSSMTQARPELGSRSEVEVEVEEEVEVETEVEVEVEQVSPFDRFWASYPKKRGKGAAMKVWSRMKVSNGTLSKILAALAQQSQSPQWLREGGQYIPYPQKWLSEQRWLDEPETAQQEAFGEAKAQYQKSRARLDLALEMSRHLQSEKERK